MDRIIYKVTCLTNNKIYIGQTRNLPERIRTHLKDVKNKTSNMVFHKAIRKYGFDNFKWEILYTGEEETIDEVEVYFIYFYNSHYKTGHGYNMSFGKSNKGYKHTDEFKLAQSIRHKGNQYNLGRKKTNEQIEAMRTINLGSKRSEETKRTMNSGKIKTEKFTFNKGDLCFEGTLYDFTNIYGLDRSNVNKLINGKLKKHKGWSTK